MRKVLALLVSLFIGFQAFADGVIEPRKVENVTIKDLYGNYTNLPHYGEKNLLIFYVDPDAYLAMNKNNKFAEELEANSRAAGPEIYGFGILNLPDTWLPKEFLRKICRKRVEKNGALIIEDHDHTFKNACGLGDCNKKFALLIGVLYNIFALGFFKYSGFIVETVNGVFGSSVEYSPLALPIGISFYTFQIMSYIIDVYYGTVRAQRRLLPFMTYISMYPQLMQHTGMSYSELVDGIIQLGLEGAEDER